LSLYTLDFGVCGGFHDFGEDIMAGTNVFISYRRDDAAGHAGRLYDRLIQKFGEAQVFFDVEAIPGATDFTEEIRDALGRSNVVIVVIGPQWLAKGRGKASRLHNPKDLVRAEIRTALHSKAIVIPTLVAGGRMPDAEELPKDITELHNLNAVEISDRSFSKDVEKLIATIARMGKVTTAGPIDAEITPGHWEIVGNYMGSSVSTVMELCRDGSVKGQMAGFGGEAGRCIDAAAAIYDAFGLGDVLRQSIGEMTLKGRWRYDPRSKVLTLRCAGQSPGFGPYPEEESQYRITGCDRGVYQALDQKTLGRVTLKRIG
jgi:hypothetical protein